MSISYTMLKHHIWSCALSIVSLFLFLILWGCNGVNSTSHKVDSSDTIYSAQKAMEIYDYNPNRAMLIIDSAEVIKNISYFRAQFLRAKVLSQSCVEQHLDSAYSIALSLVDCDSVENDLNNKFDVLELLSNISRLKGDEENSLRWLTQLENVCHEQGDEISALRTNAEIGAILVLLGESKMGEAKLDNAISSLDRYTTFNGMDACVIAMKRKISVIAESNLNEVINLSKRIISKMDYYESHYDKCHDDSYRETAKNDVPKYCNFYRAQAFGFMANAYAMTGNHQEASKALAMFEKSDLSHTINGRMTVVLAYCEMGEFNKVLTLYDEVEKSQLTDTINRSFARLLRCSAIAMGATGKQKQGIGLWKRYNNLVQRVNNELPASKAHDYAARYHLEEQQHKIQENETEIKYMRLSIVASIVAFLLALAFAIYFFSQRCKMSTKNKILTAQISEANKYKIKYTELTEAKTKEETENEAYNQQEDDSKLSIDDTTDYVKVFEIMSAAIISKQLYLDPNMGRQTLIDLFGVSKEVVGSAFAKGSEYGSLTSFINTCRLTHAVKLLDDNKEMSIKEIALASGYYNVNTFSRNFKAKYSMSPSEYRIIKT